MAMAGLATYGGSLQNMMLMQNDQNADALVAMLGSCSPHISLQQVSQSMGGFDEASFGGQNRGLYSYAGPYGDGGAELEPGSEDGDELGGDQLSPGWHVEKKRRLSFDQVRALERNFEVDNKLEPERKMQLAKELGLQPRQVAVWFQNRRARWKIKQLERDFEVLTQDYHRVQADLEAVTRDNNSLKAQVNRLKGIPTDDDNVTPIESEQRRSGDRAASPAQSDRSDFDYHACTSLSPAADHPPDSAPTAAAAAAAAAAAGSVRRTASSDSINSSGMVDSPCSRDMSRVELQPPAMDTSCCRPRNNINNSINNNNSSSRSPGELARFAPESLVDPHLMVSEPLADDQLSSHVASFHDVHRGAGAVKGDDNIEHAFLLSRLDDQPVLPSWWDWA